MKSLSVLKILASVIILVVGLSAGAAADSAGTTADSTATKEIPGEKKKLNCTYVAQNIDLFGDAARTECADAIARMREERETRKEKQAACLTETGKQADITRKLNGYCKEIEDKKGESLASAIKSCETMLTECTEAATTEKSFLSLESILGPTMGLDSSEGICSPYTTDKLETLVKTKTGDLLTADTKLAKAKDDQVDKEKTYGEKSQELQQEFQKLQDEKVENEGKTELEEEARLEAFEKLKQDYTKQTRDVASAVEGNLEIQRLAISKREIEVVGWSKLFPAIIRNCRAQVKAKFPDEKVVGSFRSARANMKDKQDELASCVDAASNKRITEAMEFKATMAAQERKISDAMTQQKLLSDSFARAQQQFATATQRVARKKESTEKSHMAALNLKFTAMQTLNNNRLRAVANEQTTITKDTNNVTQASNELAKLKKQTPLGSGSKTPAEVRDYIGELASASKKIEILGGCKAESNKTPPPAGSTKAADGKND